MSREQWFRKHDRGVVSEVPSQLRQVRKLQIHVQLFHKHCIEGINCLSQSEPLSAGKTRCHVSDPAQQVHIGLYKLHDPRMEHLDRHGPFVPISVPYNPSVHLRDAPGADGLPLQGEHFLPSRTEVLPEHCDRIIPRVGMIIVLQSRELGCEGRREHILSARRPLRQLDKGWSTALDEPGDIVPYLSFGLRICRSENPCRDSDTEERGAEKEKVPSTHQRPEHASPLAQLRPRSGGGNLVYEGEVYSKILQRHLVLHFLRAEIMRPACAKRHSHRQGKKSEGRH
mmetsp:Transcript_33729/g.45599  ORF Transcript_33729/g.45599 Transcript_33729/m.45599 type:complete len:284 (-) Transcript_33729:97-948(-)